MNTCEVCGTPIPRTVKMCEDCEDGSPVQFQQESEEESSDLEESEEEF